MMNFLKTYRFAFLWYCILFGVGYELYEFFSFQKHIRFSDLFSPKYYINYYWILLVYIFSEFCFISLCKYHERKEKQLNISEDEKKQSLQNISIIIPIHHTPLDEVRNNVIYLNSIFPPGSIHIAENDEKEHGNEELYEICQKNNAYYHHYPVGNKANAILKTAKYIQTILPEVKHVVLLDDDTIIEPDFFIRQDILADPTVAGYTCCIGIERKNPEKSNWIEECVDLEYRTISYRNRSRNLHSLKFLHGIICVYKIDCLIEIFKWNVCNIGGLPFGEDAFAGLKSRTIGYKLKQDHLNSVRTFCPSRLYPSINISREQGYGASSVFKQRAKRWYVSWLRRLPEEVALLLTYDSGNWLGNILYRFDFIWYIYITFISSIWMLLLVATFFDIRNFILFLIVHSGFYVVNILNNYWRIFNMNTKEKHGIDWKTPLFYYLFNINILLMYTFAFFYSIFYYIPFVRIDYKKLYANEKY